MSNFKVEFNLVFREKDNFNEGCDPDSSIQEFLDQPISLEAETIPELLTAVQKHFKVDRESLLLNSCDEIGRLDVQTYTKGSKGLKCAYKQYKEVFHNDQCELWLNNITGSVVRLPVAVDLSEYETPAKPIKLN